MTKIFQKFRRDKSGMTSIEYALLAGVMGTGVLLSINYVADEMTAMIQPKGCTWDKIEQGEENTSVACIGSESWSPRRAKRPTKTRTASSSN